MLFNKKKENILGKKGDYKGSNNKKCPEEKSLNVPRMVLEQPSRPSSQLFLSLPRPSPKYPSAEQNMSQTMPLGPILESQKYMTISKRSRSYVNLAQEEEPADEIFEACIVPSEVVPIRKFAVHSPNDFRIPDHNSSHLSFKSVSQ